MVTRFRFVPTIVETAARRQVLDVREQVFDPLRRIGKLQFPHPGRVEDQTAIRHCMKLAPRRGVPTFRIILANGPGLDRFAIEQRIGQRRFPDVWMNVINVEADHGTTEAALFETFYGEPQDWHAAGWREMAAFSSCVLRPLEWAGLLIETREDGAGKRVCHVFKTPLWRSALNLNTDEMLRPMSAQ